MTDQKKNSAAGASGASRYSYPKANKPIPFPQERLLWSALQECVRRMDKEATPINKTICELVAAAWKKAHKTGGDQ